VPHFAIRLITGRRTKYLVLAFWIAIIVVVAPLASRLSGAENNETKSWLPAKAESTKVLELERLFQSKNLMEAVVVYERPSGLTEADRSKVVADVSRLAAVGHLDGTVEGPQISADGKAAVTVLPLDLGSDGFRRSGVAVDRITQIARGQTGLEAYVTGPAGYAATSSKAFGGIDSTLLFGTILIVVLILLITYRSPTLWLLPIASSGVALLTSQAAIYELARRAGLTVNAMSVGILTVLVFGAGTDYALLLVARYREELRRNEDRHVAMRVALSRASSAIVASASTVILGLLCLVLAETNSTKGLGPVAAIGVGVALITMLTLLPVLLMTAGRRVFWPFRPQYGSGEPTKSGPWARMGRSIGRHPRPVWIATALLLAAMALAATTFHANGLTNGQSYRGHPDAVTGEAVLGTHFPAGVGAPVVVMSKADSASQVRQILARTPGIASVTPAVTRDGEAFMQGTMTPAPDSQAAFDLIDHVRRELRAVPGAGAIVGGGTAVSLDVERAAARDRNLIIPIVLLVVFVILIILLRALIAPLVLMGTVVLSLLATLGVSSLIFTHVFGFAGAESALPLYIFVFLVALGIDYNIFLMTRVREESKRSGTLFGAIEGLAATGGVITSAGFVLAGTFAVLATLPLTTFTEIGFAVAFGVLLDTIVVRSVLVTALNLELGDRVWWPSGLSRREVTVTPVSSNESLEAAAQPRS
jgi:putative drug exporter of the RND superfamily